MLTRAAIASLVGLPALLIFFGGVCHAELLLLVALLGWVVPEFLLAQFALCQFLAGVGYGAYELVDYVANGE